MKYYDTHMHSLCSDDGRDPVASLCEAALKMGLSGIAVTDHCDIDRGRASCERVFDCLSSEIRLARERFGDRLRISMGLELGEAHHNPSLAREIALRGEIDFIIGSLHRLRGEEDFYFIDYDRADLESLLGRYYDELVEMAELGCFDVMAHIGYQTRYMSDAARARVSGIPGMDFSDRLRELFTAIVKGGKGIEVNATVMRMGEDGIFPSSGALRAFRGMGGEIVTTGSDSHLAVKVGSGIPEVTKRLKDAGFERAFFFEKRVPMAYEL